MRQIWEDYDVEFEKNYTVNNYSFDEKYKCKHLINGKIKLLVEGTNEGGYNSVGMCGECLLEELKNRLENQ